jgi:hypothetical protein
MKANQSPDQRWQTQKNELKLRFTFLVDSDFRYDYGMKDVMMTNLQKKLGKSREELNVLLTTL